MATTRYNGAKALTLVIVIYIALIPAVFDLQANKAYAVSATEFEHLRSKYTTTHDVLIHDGPDFRASLESVWIRKYTLKTAIKQEFAHQSPSLVPRWYQPDDDVYFYLQRRSFIHYVYPFL